MTKYMTAAALAALIAGGATALETDPPAETEAAVEATEMMTTEDGVVRSTTRVYVDEAPETELNEDEVVAEGDGEAEIVMDDEAEVEIEIETEAEDITPEAE